MQHMSAATSAEPESVGLTWARRASLAASLSAPSFAPQPTLPAFTAQFIPPEPIFLPIEPHEPSPDDLDETNTRIFIKSLPPEFHDYSYLYRLFRAFGKIRMLAINTKRHNAIVEFESKEAALAAKSDTKCISAQTGKVYTVKMFWGKHISREPPLKNAPPTFSQQVERVRNVDAIQTRATASPVPTAWLNQILGLFTPEEINYIGPDKEEAKDLPPGLESTNDALGAWFSHCDVNKDTCGKYPLKSSHVWFKDTRMGRPTISSPTQIIAFPSPKWNSPSEHSDIFAPEPVAWSPLEEARPSMSSSTSSLFDFSSPMSSSVSSYDSIDSLEDSPSAFADDSHFIHHQSLNNSTKSPFDSIQPSRIAFVNVGKQDADSF